MSNLVKYMHSTQAGAPTMSGLAGQMVGVLNACLVDGYNLKSITGITRTGQTATVACSAHGNVADQVLLIAGATQAEYNGEFRIFNVTTNTFDITVTGTPATPATGTMTCKVAPLGFERPFTGTNKAVYRSANPQSNRLFLRVNDAATLAAAVHFAVNMTDVDNGTGIGPIPTGIADTVFQQRAMWRKSNAADATTRRWVIIGDDKTFYFFVYWSATYPLESNTGGFGDIEKFMAGDAFSTLMLAEDNAAATAPSSASYTAYQGFLNNLNYVNDPNGSWLARSYSAVSGAVGVRAQGIGSSGASGANGYLQPYPSPLGELDVHPLYAAEGVAALRGRVRGLLQIVHKTSPGDTVIVDNMAGGGKVLCIAANSAVVAVDLTGPWG